MSEPRESRVYEALSRIELKVDDQGTRLSRIEGAISAVETLKHEDRIRELEMSRRSLEVRLGLWGGIAGVAALLGTLLTSL